MGTILVFHDVRNACVRTSSLFQAAQGKAARKKHGRGGKFEAQHLSPACAWLDAQHDARRGARFLQGITGELSAALSSGRNAKY